MNKQKFLNWVLPGIVFSVSFGFAACSDAMKGNPKDCATSGGGHGSTSGNTSTGSSHFDGGTTIDQPPGGVFTSSNDPDNTFDHFNDPGSDGAKDPFEILKQRAEEGPPEVRTRLHSCTKISYAALGAFLTSRGVNLSAKSTSGPKTAGELYSQGADALGVAKFDAREGESYFHTTASATKLFDIFVQAAPEIIANIAGSDACKVNGVGHAMFDSVTGKCSYEALSCIMGRPATLDDLTICNLMIEQADTTNPADVKIKQNITVATFLAAANTCE